MAFSKGKIRVYTDEITAAAQGQRMKLVRKSPLCNPAKPNRNAIESLLSRWVTSCVLAHRCNLCANPFTSQTPLAAKSSSRCLSHWITSLRPSSPAQLLVSSRLPSCLAQLLVSSQQPFCLARPPLLRHASSLPPSFLVPAELPAELHVSNRQLSCQAGLQAEHHASSQRPSSPAPALVSSQRPFSPAPALASNQRPFSPAPVLASNQRPSFQDWLLVQPQPLLRASNPRPCRQDEPLEL